MCELINSVQMIQHFLQECEKNTVYLHCQDNKLRSAIFFVAYLYITDPRVNHDIS